MVANYHLGHFSKSWSYVFVFVYIDRGRNACAKGGQYGDLQSTEGRNAGISAVGSDAKQGF